MVEFAFWLLALVVIVLADLVAIWYGTDSRDGNDWANHRSF
jgi:hypothetical protein